MRIGIVVENYEEVPHETEQINARILKKELEKLGEEADILFFNWGGGKKVGGVVGFSDGGDYDAFYLSGKISNYHFMKLLFLALRKRKTIHFRVPSYNFSLFKRFRFFIKLLIKLKLLRLYSFDEFHKKRIIEEIGINTEILEPCIYSDDGIEGVKKENDILFIGSYADWKRGLTELLRVVKILKKKIPNIKLRVLSRYGFYDDENNWASKLCEKLGIKENVIFSGKVEDIASEYKKARVYVLPVKIFKLMPPIPYSILESLYYGTPVIATEHYGVGEILGERFLLDKDLDEKELAEKILWVLENNPKVSLEERFLPENAARKFLSLIKKLFPNPYQT